MLAHITEEVFLAPSGEHGRRNAAQVRVVIGAQNGTLRTALRALADFPHPQIVGEPYAPFGQLEVDLLAVDQAHWVSSKFLLRPSFSRVFVISQHRNALLFHPGKELGRVAFPIKDEAKAARYVLRHSIIPDRLDSSPRRRAAHPW